MSAKAKELVSRLGSGATIRTKKSKQTDSVVSAAPTMCSIPGPHPVSSAADNAVVFSPSVQGNMENTELAHPTSAHSRTADPSLEFALPTSAHPRTAGSSKCVQGNTEDTELAHPTSAHPRTADPSLEFAHPTSAHPRMAGSSKEFANPTSAHSRTEGSDQVFAHPTAAHSRMAGASMEFAHPTSAHPRMAGASMEFAQPTLAHSRMAGASENGPVLSPSVHAGMENTGLAHSATALPRMPFEGYASAHGYNGRPQPVWPGYGYMGFGFPGFDQGFSYGFPPFHGGPPNRFPWPGNTVNHTQRPSLPPTPPLLPSPLSPPAQQEQLVRPNSHGSLDHEATSSPTSSGDEHSASDCEDDNPNSSSSFSFSEAIQRLAHVAPDLVSSAPSSTGRLSAAERILGRASARPDSGRALVESPLVAEAFQAAFSKIRGQEEAPIKGSVPSLPAALPCGTFLKGDKPPFKKEALISGVIPSATLSATREDLLLLPEGKFQSSGNLSAQVKDKTLREFENLARLGLQSSSVLDSFLGGLVNLVKDDSVDDFVIKQDIDSGDFLSFIQALSETLKFTSSNLASLYANIVLTRRDSFLLNSQILKNSKDCQSSLRSLPIHATSLFGGEHVAPTIHSLAESKRDLAFAAPRPPRSSSLPARGRTFSHGKPRAHSRSSSSFVSNRGGRFKSSNAQKKPYSRKQTSKASGKQQSPQ